VPRAGSGLVSLWLMSTPVSSGAEIFIALAVPMGLPRGMFFVSTTPLLRDMVWSVPSVSAGRAEGSALVRAWPSSVACVSLSCPSPEPERAAT
jgi:hypothetical protein